MQLQVMICVFVSSEPKECAIMLCGSSGEQLAFHDKQSLIKSIPLPVKSMVTVQDFQYIFASNNSLADLAWNPLSSVEHLN